MIENSLVLGAVTWIGYRAKIRAASIRPIAHSTTDHTQWERSYTDDADIEFLYPNTGRVSWLHAPDDLRKQSVWVFEVLHQPTFTSDNKNRDRYMVNEQTILPAREVYDVADYGGERIARDTLTRVGVKEPAGDQGAIYVRCGELIAATHLVHKGDGSGLWCIPLSQIEKDPLRFYDCPGEAAVVHVTIDGSVRNFLLPGVHLSGRPRLRDWAPDEIVLRHVLRRLRRWDKNYAEQLGLTERAIEGLTSVLAAPQANNNDLEMDIHRLERAKGYIEHLQTSADLAKAVAQALANGPVADAIGEERAKIRDSEIVAARANAVQAIAAERGQLATVQSSIMALRKEEQAVREQIDAARHEHEQAVRRLEEGLANRVREILASPERLLEDVAILRAAGVAGNGRPTAQSVTAVAAQLPDSPAVVRASSLTDIVDFQRCLKQAMIVSDVPLSASAALFSTLLAGLVPVVTGSRVQATVSEFGRLACATKILRVPIVATYLDPLDLFGRVDADSRRFVPARGGLARFLCQAMAGDRLSLVVLEGVNLAPTESFFLPIVLAYVDAWRRTATRTLEFFDPAEVEMGDPFATLASFHWPKNVLLVATAVDGASTLPLPRSLWQYATLIPTDHMEYEEHSFLSHRAETTLSEPHLVPMSAWSSWRAALKEDDTEEAARQWSKVSSTNKLMRGGIDSFTGLYAAARSCSVPATTALGMAISHVALPLLIHTDHAEKAFRTVKTPYFDLTAAIDEAARLGGR
jgi:hypothetical protein